ncbi:SDR family oxidoreductase [Arthrobacter globiformis]|uniref:SDR family oxidoreductase n=1 Tax=Arthrobacter globiformis TaxID=1665 RepID=UPI00278E18C6|nr:SDR family oxidoreductase [Arthrobacter globiformis]MDQ0618408.1 NAD(P)-dependent dehydrogenase (short-subunit alcohol dehydrogenase family) [Arthrobacter globiformis]
MVNIKDTVILVTGANGGLGSEFVHQALERGAAKVYAAARTPRTWEDARVVPLTLDVTDQDSIGRAAAAAGDVAIVINNAGIYGASSLVDGPEDELRQQMETNFFGPIAITRAFAPALRAAQGALVNIASVVSWLPIANAYSTSKAALWSATNALRLDLAQTGVHVVGAYLSYTDTPMSQQVREDANDPADVVREILDGVEAGEDEVLADETTRRVRAGLSGPIGALVAAVSGN